MTFWWTNKNENIRIKKAKSSGESLPQRRKIIMVYERCMPRALWIGDRERKKSNGDDKEICSVHTI